MTIIELFEHFSPLSYLCFILGFILIIVEMSHPGISFPGVIGTILLIVGVAVTARNALEALIIIIVLLALLGIALAIVINSATRGKLSQNVVLHETIEGSSVNVDSNDLYYLINKEGKALTTLRPSGTADFDGVKLDVISEGDFIERGSKVKIIKIESFSILVRKID